MRRPLGITILSVLLGFAAVTLILGPVILRGSTDMFLGGVWGAVGLGVGCAFAAFGLWRGLFAGWVAALAVQAFQAAINLTRAQGWEVLFALVFPAIVVGYLLTREARAWCKVGRH